jgi:hypothetical protein
LRKGIEASCKVKNEGEAWGWKKVIETGRKRERERERRRLNL